jgi:hypothetical protein
MGCMPHMKNAPLPICRSRRASPSCCVQRTLHRSDHRPGRIDLGQATRRLPAQARIEMTSVFVPALHRASRRPAIRSMRLVIAPSGAQCGAFGMAFEANRVPHVPAQHCDALGGVCIQYPHGARVARRRPGSHNADLHARADPGSRRHSRPAGPFATLSDWCGEQPRPMRVRSTDRTACTRAGMRRQAGGVEALACDRSTRTFAARAANSLRIAS